MSAHLLSLKIPVVEFPPRTLYSATKSYISEDDTFVICLFISSIGSYLKKKKKEESDSHYIHDLGEQAQWKH